MGLKSFVIGAKRLEKIYLKEPTDIGLFIDFPNAMCIHRKV